MRITNKTLTSNYLRNLNRNLAQVEKFHNQLSSGKTVSKPSDNPMLVSKIMSLRDNILANEQYNTNISDTIGWVETQDTALGDVSSTLNRIRDLMIYGANGSLSDTDRAAIKDEVEQHVGQLVDVLNTNFDGRYIFAGQATTTRPFEIDEDSGIMKYMGDTNNISREISTGVEIKLITSGRNIVGGEVDSEGNLLGEDLGTFLDKVVEALDSNDTPRLSGELLSEIDSRLDTVLSARSKIGASYNRLEAAEARNKAENLNLKSLLSQREDIDIAEKYMEFSVMNTVYQASLKTGAQILQPTLLDYIR